MDLKLANISGWNISASGDDLMICMNYHHRSEKCDYDRWTPERLEACFTPEQIKALRSRCAVDTTKDTSP